MNSWIVKFSEVDDIEMPQLKLIPTILLKSCLNFVAYHISFYLEGISEFLVSVLYKNIGV